jgi:hypothetical protein
VHVATDGESYGHHHKHGEMALAYALRLLEADKTVKLTNYGSFLEQFPPEYEVRDCGKHLVELRARRGALALELRLQRRQAGLQPALARAAAPGAGRAARRRGSADRAGGRKLFKDVWARATATSRWCSTAATESVDRFFARMQSTCFPETERVRALELMEMQRHAQLMYTSCGWFFDDISGIETVQIIAYAARVLQLAKELLASRPRAGAGVSGAMAEAKSNVASAGDGAQIYKACVATWSWAWSRWRRTTPSARSSPRLPRRPTCSAIACGASPTTSTPPAADGWRWAGRTLPAPSPAAAELLVSRFCTSATRTLPPP